MKINKRIKFVNYSFYKALILSSLIILLFIMCIVDCENKDVFLRENSINPIIRRPVSMMTFTNSNQQQYYPFTGNRNFNSNENIEITNFKNSNILELKDDLTEEEERVLKQKDIANNKSFNNRQVKLINKRDSIKSQSTSNISNKDNMEIDEFDTLDQEDDSKQKSLSNQIRIDNKNQNNSKSNITSQAKIYGKTKLDQETNKNNNNIKQTQTPLTKLSIKNINSLIQSINLKTATLSNINNINDSLDLFFDNSLIEIVTKEKLKQSLNNKDVQISIPKNSYFKNDNVIIAKRNIPSNTRIISYPKFSLLDSSSKAVRKYKMLLSNSNSDIPLLIKNNFDEIFLSVELLNLLSKEGKMSKSAKTKTKIIDNDKINSSNTNDEEIFSQQHSLFFFDYSNKYKSSHTNNYGDKNYNGREHNKINEISSSSPIFWSDSIINYYFKASQYKDLIIHLKNQYREELNFLIKNNIIIHNQLNTGSIKALERLYFECRSIITEQSTIKQSKISYAKSKRMFQSEKEKTVVLPLLSYLAFSQYSNAVIQLNNNNQYELKSTKEIKKGFPILVSNGFHSNLENFLFFGFTYESLEYKENTYKGNLISNSLSESNARIKKDHSNNKKANDDNDSIDIEKGISNGINEQIKVNSDNNSKGSSINNRFVPIKTSNVYLDVEVEISSINDRVVKDDSDTDSFSNKRHYDIELSKRNPLNYILAVFRNIILMSEGKFSLFSASVINRKNLFSDSLSSSSSSGIGIGNNTNNANNVSSASNSNNIASNTNNSLNTNTANSNNTSQLSNSSNITNIKSNNTSNSNDSINTRIKDSNSTSNSTQSTTPSNKLQINTQFPSAFKSFLELKSSILNNQANETDSNLALNLPITLENEIHSVDLFFKGLKKRYSHFSSPLEFDQNKINSLITDIKQEVIKQNKQLLSKLKNRKNDNSNKNIIEEEGELDNNNLSSKEKRETYDKRLSLIDKLNIHRLLYEEKKIILRYMSYAKVMLKILRRIYYEKNKKRIDVEGNMTLSANEIKDLGNGMRDKIIDNKAVNKISTLGQLFVPVSRNLDSQLSVPFISNNNSLTNNSKLGSEVNDLNKANQVNLSKLNSSLFYAPFSFISLKEKAHLNNIDNTDDDEITIDSNNAGNKKNSDNGKDLYDELDKEDNQINNNLSLSKSSESVLKSNINKLTLEDLDREEEEISTSLLKSDKNSGNQLSKEEKNIINELMKNSYGPDELEQVVSDTDRMNFDELVSEELISSIAGNRYLLEYFSKIIKVFKLRSSLLVEYKKKIMNVGIKSFLKESRNKKSSSGMSLVDDE